MSSPIARPAALAAFAALAILFVVLSLPSHAQGTQQAEIHALVQELDYLIAYSERLSERYRHDDAPVQFNYSALIEQLRTTRERTASYLNETHAVVHPAPPGTVDRSLTRRR